MLGLEDETDNAADGSVCLNMINEFDVASRADASCAVGRAGRSIMPTGGAVRGRALAPSIILRLLGLAVTLTRSMLETRRMLGVQTLRSGTQIFLIVWTSPIVD